MVIPRETEDKLIADMQNLGVQQLKVFMGDVENLANSDFIGQYLRRE